MPFLYQLLLTLSSKVLSFAFKKLLLGAGIGLGSFVVSQLMFNQLLDFVHARFELLSSIFFLIDMAGVDEGLSFIISGISFKITMNAGKLALKKI